jgi:hypothetical protein
MGRDSASAPAADTLAAPAPAPKAAPVAPKVAPASGATTKPAAPKAAAPTPPAAPAAPPAPEPATPAAAGERRYGAPSPFGVSTLQDQPSYLPRQVTRETTLPLRMPEYEQRLARVRELRQDGKLRIVPTEAVEFKVSPSPSRRPATISTAPAIGGRGSLWEARPENPTKSAPLDSPAEFAKQAEQLGTKYAQLQGTIQELDQLRRKYELEKKSQPLTVSELSRRNPLEVLAGRTPVREVDRKLADVARRTRAANQDVAQTIVDLRQYGFTDQNDVERAFGDLVPALTTPAASGVHATLRLPPKR